MRLMPFLCALAFFSVLTLASGCDCSGPVQTHGTPCTTNAQCHGGQLCVDGTCRVPADTGPGTDAARPGVDAPAPIPAGLTIDPPMATVTSTDGSHTTQAFTARLTLDDGTTVPASGVGWTLDTRNLGDIDSAGGTFTANGVVGGTATVTATASTSHGNFMATAMLEVVIVRNVMGPGTPADIATTFGSATSVTDPAREAGLVYPLEGAVMPQNVYPADIQWTRGATGDLLRVTLTKPSLTATAYLVDDGLHHWLADADVWRSLAQTNGEMPATIRVDRIDPSTHELVRGSDLHMSFARAALTGSVYYWDIVAGHIQRIDDGTATRVNFMPNPEQGCVGCHSVSPSGRYMAGRYGGGDNVGTVFDLTADLTGSPPASVFSANMRALYWWFSTWSPDETRLLVAAQSGPEIRLYDPMTGTRVATPSLAGVTGTYPAWSHDGNHIAFVQNTAGVWGDDPQMGDISLMDVTAPDTFGAPRIIHHGSDLPGGVCDSYPTWAPDGTLLAFGHGTGARSESRMSDLFIMAPDGSAVRALSAASPGTHDDFQPRFSPFTQGGYFWMSFLSRRIYGNPQIGNSTSSASPSRRQQIWVTAIRTDGAGGADPSSVPYWLPGQDPHSANIAAYWAARACRADGDACDVGSECCGGECLPGPGGALVCSPPPVERCHHATETCSTDADCCASESLVCQNHVCIHPPM